MLGVGVSVDVFVACGVIVAVDVDVLVGVGVLLGVDVDVLVGRSVLVGVLVGVDVFVGSRVLVGVLLGVNVGVGVEVLGTTNSIWIRGAAVGLPSYATAVLWPVPPIMTTKEFPATQPGREMISCMIVARFGVR